MSVTPTIVPHSFAASVGAIVEFTGVMHDASLDTNHLPAAGSISEYVEPLIMPTGSVTRITQSLFPGGQMGGGSGTQQIYLAPGFRNESNYVQDVFNAHVFTRSHTPGLESGRSKDLPAFLNRLSSITGIGIQELLGCRDEEGVGNWITDLDRMGSVKFGVLETIAKRKLGEKKKIVLDSEEEDAVDSVARPLIERGLLFMVLDDQYASEIAEGCFCDVASILKETPFVGVSGIMADLASREYDKNHSIGIDRLSEPNPHSELAGGMIRRSIEEDPDPSTFAKRYMSGLYHTTRAGDMESQQMIFGASVAFFEGKGMRRDMARAMIREASTFTKRKDSGIDAAAWRTISERFASAAEIFITAGNFEDKRAVDDLNDLSKTALGFAGHA